MTTTCRPSSSITTRIRCLSAWEPFEASHGSKIQALPEVRAVQDLLQFLQRGQGDGSVRDHKSQYKHTLSPSQYRLALDAAMVTFSLHTHARIASLVGKGYYTIGPCGEELLSAAALAFQPIDTTALHYRHTGMSIARQLADNNTLEEVLLAQARGYTVSKYDPVTGGVHRCIGGGNNEFLVTSTLSSQCPAAVGRALGFALQRQVEQESSERSPPNKPISFTTIGDGSLHHHHFLSSLTLARHAKHLNIKCPIVFGISNNGLSISYETKNYIDTVFQKGNDPLLPVFCSDGHDMMDVYDQTKQACDYARQYQSPCVLVYSTTRRFGHAATDRQDAYLDADQIQSMADTCVLKLAMTQAVEQLNITTYSELHERFQEIHQSAERAFGQAMLEPKVTLDEMLERVSAPLASLPPSNSNVRTGKNDSNKPQVMRKHMNRCFRELLEQDSSVVYMGEDVRHGGYYLVTEDLAQAFPSRVLDFPPDETTLLGAALGFSQLGLLPIVEIPYAKYLDCGVDMFYEIAIQRWLSPPNKARNCGMIIRLQGFDRGLFGGNFHTHNMLSHMPPGVDVVCFSNGADYVRGMRHAILQAKAGRVVMTVDCTHLLNLRHVNERDRAWEFGYPEEKEDLLTFDDIRVNGEGTASMAIVSYGNGIVTSLQARRGLVDRGILESEADLDVIDSPYLSAVSRGLEDALSKYDSVVFADICKTGPGSNVFSSMITTLQENGTLPPNWRFVGSPRTYNPLGSNVTFLNQDQIEDAVEKLLQNSASG